MLQRTSESVPELANETRPIPVPPKTKAWLPDVRTLASIPERSIRSPPDAPAPSKAMAAPSAPADVADACAGGRVADEVEVEDVVALAAEQELRSRAADQPVVAVAADEDVVAGVAAEGVVAGVAVELVLAAGALDRVGELVAVAVDGVAADDRQVLDAEAQVVAT